MISHKNLPFHCMTPCLFMHSTKPIKCIYTNYELGHDTNLPKFSIIIQSFFSQRIKEWLLDNDAWEQQ